MSTQAAGHGLQPADGNKVTATLVSWLRVGSIAALSVLSASCGGSLFESQMPAPVRYVIEPPPPAAAPTDSPAAQFDVAIGRPDVAPGLDTDRIAVIRGHKLDYFRGALWAGTLLETVQAFLVSTFQDQKLFRSVAAEQSRIGGQYLLDIEVRHFQAEYRDGSEIPEVRVTLVARLVRIADRKLIGVLNASGSRPARENRMTEVAAAFQTVMQQVSLDLASQTAQLITTTQQQRPAD